MMKLYYKLAEINLFFEVKTIFFPLTINKCKVISFISKINHFVNHSFKIKYKIIDNKSYKMLSFVSFVGIQMISEILPA